MWSLLGEETLLCRCMPTAQTPSQAGVLWALLSNTRCCGPVVTITLTAVTSEIIFPTFCWFSKKNTRNITIATRQRDVWCHLPYQISDHCSTSLGSSLNWVESCRLP